MNLRTIFAASLVSIFVSGCASAPPTAAEKMYSQSEGTRQLADQWQRGKDLVVRGERMKAEGEEITNRGELKIKEGERLIAEGSATMKESELIYEQRFPGRTLEADK